MKYPVWPVCYFSAGEGQAFINTYAKLHIFRVEIKKNIFVFLHNILKTTRYF